MPLWISEQMNASASMKILLANPVVAGRLRAVVQLGNAGFIQLREQHHGPHNEPVRSSVITSFDAGSASVAFSPNPIFANMFIADIAGEQQHLEDGRWQLPKLRRNPTTNAYPWHEQWSDCWRWDFMNLQQNFITPQNSSVGRDGFPNKCSY